MELGQWTWTAKVKLAFYPFTNTKSALQELDFDRVVCMTAICYDNSI